MSYDVKEKSQYGGSPVELYRFQSGSALWTFTSADRAQSYTGLTFAPEVISRGEIDASDEDTQGALEITLLRTNPVADLFIPDLPVQPVTLTLYRFHRGDSDVVQFWSGEISAVQFSGSSAKLTGIPVSRALRKQLPPNTFQAQCNWALFSPECGLDKAAYKQTATITAVSGLTISATAFGSHPDGYFQSGWVQDVNGETHWVTQHVGTTLTLLTPFRGLLVGASVDAYPGCDRTIAACKVFGNLIHHCGFAFIPTKNPFVTGVA